MTAAALESAGDIAHVRLPPSAAFTDALVIARRNLRRIARNHHMVAINGAREIDLTGQVVRDSSRQIAHRARQRVRSERPRFEVDPTRRQALLHSFLVAVVSGEPARLQELLAEDVVLVSDGGPSRHAARRPVVGPHRVSRFVVNLARRVTTLGDVVMAEVNGAPAVLIVANGEVRRMIVPEFDGALLRRIEFLSAPEKLAATHELVGPLRRM